MLFHDNLSKHNIVVDDSGALTRVLDRECVSVLPLWTACYYPSFPECPTRDKEPDRTRYSVELTASP
jgi:hypothetical protein